MKKRINKNKWWLIATAMIGFAAPISLIPVLTSCSISAPYDDWTPAPPTWQEMDTNPFYLEDDNFSDQSSVKPEYIQTYKNEKMLVIPENIYTSVWIKIDQYSSLDYSYIVIPKNVYRVSIDINGNDFIKNLFWGEIGNYTAINYPLIKSISYSVNGCDNFDWFALPNTEVNIEIDRLGNNPKLRNSTINLQHLSALSVLGHYNLGSAFNKYIGRIVLPDTNNSKLWSIQPDTFRNADINNLDFPASLKEIGEGACYYIQDATASFRFNSSTAIRYILREFGNLQKVFSPPKNKRYFSLDLRKCIDLTNEEKELLKIQSKDLFDELYLP